MMRMMKIKYILILLILPCLTRAADLPTISTVSSDFVSVISETEQNSTTIAIYGNNFSELIYNSNYHIYLGDIVGQNISGNSQEINATFNFTSADIQDDIHFLKITENDTIIFQSEIPITVFNPYKEEYQKSNVKKYLTKNHTKNPSKKYIGLNVHQTLASVEATDAQYQQKLSASHTVWVREHFSHQQIMGTDQAAWVTRYDKIMLQYRASGQKVVGMLAYDLNQNYTNPSPTDFENFVRYIVKRYRNYVDVWEVWNEPDTNKYLKPATVSTYKPLLKSAYGLIKYYDPDSIVLNGGIANITDLQFIDSLYRRTHDYFDAFNIHLYYCDEYQFNNNINALREDIENLEKIIFKKKRDKKVWITEIGCSTYNNHFNQNTQKDYLQKAVHYLSQKDYVQNILLYTLRDRDLADNYEAKFGLVDLNFYNKKAWAWYRQLPKK